jgi:plasmid stability protein
MKDDTTRATIYLNKKTHQALRLKAAETHRSISDIVSDAVVEALREDQEDLAIIKSRAKEKRLTYEEFIAQLKADGTI